VAFYRLVNESFRLEPAIRKPGRYQENTGKIPGKYLQPALKRVAFLGD
jgi:hypothetical protein